MKTLKTQHCRAEKSYPQNHVKHGCDSYIHIFTHFLKIPSPWQTASKGDRKTPRFAAEMADHPRGDEKPVRVHAVDLRNPSMRKSVLRHFPEARFGTLPKYRCRFHYPARRRNPRRHAADLPKTRTGARNMEPTPALCSC